MDIIDICICFKCLSYRIKLVPKVHITSIWVFSPKKKNWGAIYRHTESNNDVVSRERLYRQRSSAAIGGQALRSTGGGSPRSAHWLLRIHRCHVRCRRRHVQGLNLEPIWPPFLFLFLFLLIFRSINVRIHLFSFGYNWVSFYFLQYKLSSWLAIVFCAQSLANMRNFETDLKQVSMAMM